jgi:hypothetical protein
LPKPPCFSALAAREREPGRVGASEDVEEEAEVTRITRLITVASLSLAATLGVSTSAHAAPLWELGTPWHVLPVSQVETLKSKGLLRLFEVGKPNGAKCMIADTEVIENVPTSAGSLAAIDKMEAFTGKCFLAAPIFP